MAYIFSKRIQIANFLTNETNMKIICLLFIKSSYPLNAAKSTVYMGQI